MSVTVSGTDQGTSRREALRRALKAGGVAYVAPMVLGSAAPASAQASGPNPECTGATCATFVPCNSNSACVCVRSSAGGGYCVLGSTSCSDVGPCGAAPGYACPAGSFCALDTCCGSPVCVMFSASTPCQIPASGPAPARTAGTLWQS